MNSHPISRWISARCLMALFWIPAVFGGNFPTEAECQGVLSQLVKKNHGRGGGIARLAPALSPARVAVSGRLAGGGSALIAPGTPFEVASVTKAVTAAAVLRLSERGLLGLDWTLGQVLPADVIQGWNPNITIRQLLSHTSGLPDYWTDGPADDAGQNAFLRAFLANPSRRWTPIEMLDYAREIPAEPPGSPFHYSDTNYVLLGLAIEHAADRPLHVVFRKEIFEPLGMNATWMSFKQKPRRSPIAHRYEGAEDLTVQLRQTADWAGGGLISTAEDLEKFLRGLFSGKLISGDLLSEMYDWVPVGEPGVSYGLGLFCVKLNGGLGELIGHDGHGNAFAYYWPQRRTTLTGTLNQYDNDWWPLAEVMIGD